MTMSLGKNSVSGKAMMKVIEQVEVIRAQKDALGEDEKAIFAAAKAAGFKPDYVKLVIKARAAKPHDWQDHEATRDMYLHAAGLADELPLFRQMESVQADNLGSEALLELYKSLCPRGGQIIFKDSSDKTWRVSRDKDGKATASVVDKSEAAPEHNPDAVTIVRPPAKEVPDCTLAQSEELGAQAWKDNQPITTNPFPAGDKRRGKWDKGWRGASGSDGMGPDDE
jgi:uncharacterized protein (UPF0335 family)